MERLLWFILIALSFSGCGSRTEYGRKRLSRVGSHKLITDSIVYSLIDTAKLYEIVSAVSVSDNKPLNSMNKRYLKFYDNGRVGTFYVYRTDDLSSLNPKRAEIGYYKYNGKNLEIKTFFEHPQGGGWVKELLTKYDNDTLEFISDGILSKYKALNIPKTFLVYKADW